MVKGTRGSGGLPTRCLPQPVTRLHARAHERTPSWFAWAVRESTYVCTFPTPKRRRRQRSRDAEAWASESGAVGIPGVSFTSSARPPVCSFPFGEEKPRWSPRRARQGSPRVTMSLTSVAETEATDPRGRFLTRSRHTCRLPAKGNGMASLIMCLS